MGSKLSRRAFLQAAGLATGTAVLAACTSPTPAPISEPTKAPAGATQVPATPESKKPTTISVNDFYFGGPGYEQCGKAYRAALDKLGLDWLKTELQQADPTTLETRMAAGDAPDILFGYPELIIPWAARKQTLPLTEAINADAGWQKDVDTFIKSMNDGYMYKGSLHAITQAAEAECFSYNPQQFEKKGVKKLSEIGKDAFTLAKFEEVIAALSDSEQDGMKGWYIDLGYNSGLGDILYGFGGKYFSEDGKQALFNSPEFVEAVEFCIKQVKSGVAHNGIELSKQGTWACLALANKLTASVIAGDWCWGWAHKTQLEKKEFEPELFYIPAGPKGRHPLAHSAADAVYANTKNKEACLALMKAMSTKTFQEAIAETYEVAPRYPARHDANGPIMAKKLLPDFFAELFDDSWASPATPTINFMGILGYVNDTFNGMLTGKDTRPAKAVLDELNTRIQKDMDAASAGLSL